MLVITRKTQDALWREARLMGGSDQAANTALQVYIMANLALEGQLRIKGEPLMWSIGTKPGGGGITLRVFWPYLMPGETGYQGRVATYVIDDLGDIRGVHVGRHVDAWMIEVLSDEVPTAGRISAANPRHFEKAALALSAAQFVDTDQAIQNYFMATGRPLDEIVWLIRVISDWKKRWQT